MRFVLLFLTEFVDKESCAKSLCLDLGSGVFSRALRGTCLVACRDS